RPASPGAIKEEGSLGRGGGPPRNAPPVATDAPTGFGPWLRAERVARGWSQQDLAERLGLSAPHLSKVEGGERSLPATAFEPLAEALGQHADVLRLRAGVVPAALLARLQGDPEGALRWAGA
ncbi:MAG: helix-turn-helix domain-containing protein, partial [Myxococcota bacterium]